MFDQSKTVKVARQGHSLGRTINKVIVKAKFSYPKKALALFANLALNLINLIYKIQIKNCGLMPKDRLL